jgi:hypothetical protein
MRMIAAVMLACSQAMAAEIKEDASLPEAFASDRSRPTVLWSAPTAAAICR